MKFREYGNTGCMISQLGFGAMRLPKTEDKNLNLERSVEVLRHARDRGINYFDSALVYNNGQSEQAVGEAFSDRREDVYIATKVPLHMGSLELGKIRGYIEDQLKRLKTDYIDFWHFHDLRYEHFTDFVLPDKEGVLTEVRKARDEGLIRHLCVSAHQKPENMIKMLDTGIFEGVLLQYNFLDRKNKEVIEFAHNRGMGVVAMGPVGGGQLAQGSRRLAELQPEHVTSLPELAIRYVLANKGITCALSGMSSEEEVDENLLAGEADRPLSKSEKEFIEENVRELEELANLYCTGCGYCMPCPHGVDIPRNFRLMNDYRVFDFKKSAQKTYQTKLKTSDEGEKKLRASECIECGECEEKCPQDIDIPAQLNEVHNTLGQ